MNISLLLLLKAPSNRLGFGRLLPSGYCLQCARGFSLLQGSRAARRLPILRLFLGYVELGLHVCQHGRLFSCVRNDVRGLVLTFVTLHPLVDLPQGAVLPWRRQL